MAVCPFVVEGLDEPFDLSVAAGCVGRGEDVAGAEVASVEDVGNGWHQIATRFTVEVEGSDKPCCVGESVGRALV